MQNPVAANAFVHHPGIVVAGRRKALGQAVRPTVIGVDGRLGAVGDRIPERHNGALALEAAGLDAAQEETRRRRRCAGAEIGRAGRVTEHNIRRLLAFRCQVAGPVVCGSR